MRYCIDTASLVSKATLIIACSSLAKVGAANRKILYSLLHHAVEAASEIKRQSSWDDSGPVTDILRLRLCKQTLCMLSGKIEQVVCMLLDCSLAKIPIRGMCYGSDQMLWTAYRLLTDRLTSMAHD